MRRGVFSYLVVIVAMASMLCLALLPGRAQATPASCGARAGANSSSSVVQTMAGSAHIALSIDHGASGTAISVSGRAWPANAQIVIDFVDTGEQNLGRPGIAQARTDATGAFQSPDFQAPQAFCGRSPSAGTVSLIVAHTADSSVMAQARFTFVTSPEITTTLFSDSLTVRSASIQVSGQSWGPATLVTLYATQQDMVNHSINFSRIANAPSIQVHADANGAFQAIVPLPTGLPPAIYVSAAATATTPLYGTLARNLSMMFLLQPETYPSVALSSDEVARGATLTITGEHWRPGDVVSVESCLGAPEPDKHGIMQCGPYLEIGGAPTQLAKITVGDDGSFVVKAQIPRQAHLGATGVRIYANDASLQWYDVTLGIKVLDVQMNAGASNSSQTTLAPGAIALLLCGGLVVSLFLWRRRRNRASAISGTSGGATQSGDDDDE